MNTKVESKVAVLTRAQRWLETQRIPFLSGFVVAIAFPVILNAASLSWNPIKIAKDNGIVVLAEETAKPAPKPRVNVDSSGVILKGYEMPTTTGFRPTGPRDNPIAGSVLDD